MLIAVIATDAQRGVALSLWDTFFGEAFAAMAVAGRPLAIHTGLPTLFALYLSARLRCLP